MKKNLLFSILFFTFSVLSAQQPEAVKTDHVSGEILFQLSDNQLVSSVALSFKNKEKPNTKFIQNDVLWLIWNYDSSATSMRIEPVAESFKIWKIQFDAKEINENDLLKTLQRHPSVKTAQFNHNIELRGNPNDPLFSQQWYLPKINASSVWDKTTGGVTACGDTITVGVIEIGFYDKHADLQPNIWLNRNEIPNNRIDDDGNGFIDDYRGWNITARTDKHDTIINREFDLRHGAGVASIIGAKGNNATLISGVNWNVKMLLVSGIRNESGIIEAYTYLLKQHKLYKESNGKKGAFIPVTNMSAGFANGSPSASPLFCAVYDSLGKYGMLNFVAVDNVSVDVEKHGDMPTLCAKPSLFAVTGSKNDDKISETAFSQKFVHLAAPAENILVLGANGQTETNGGTSFATPLTSGAAALLWSIPDGGRFCQLAKTDPIAAMTALKDVLLRGVDKNENLSTKTISGGRLNLKRTYDLLLRRTGQPIGDYDVLKLAPNPVDRTLNLTFQLPETVNANIVVVNTLGQIVYDKQITNADLLKNPLTLDARQWAAGVYFVGIRTKDFEVTRKFVVAH